MKEENAKQVADLMVRIGHDLSSSVDVVKNGEPHEEYLRYQSSVSKLLTLMLIEIMNPVYLEYPHLKPSELL
jgi:hypothetical protein